MQMFNCGKGRNHLKKHFKGSSGMKVQSRVSSVPSLCMEVGGNSCISIIPSFSLELKMGHGITACECRSQGMYIPDLGTYCPEISIRCQAWLALGTFLQWANLLSPSPAVNRCSFLAWGIPWDAAAPWTCLCTSRQDLPESSWIWCTQGGQVRHTSWILSGTEQKSKSFKYAVSPMSKTNYAKSAM